MNATNFNSDDYKKIILIGRSGSGKTSLCQVLRGEELKYYKTQTIHIENQTMIDTPGEYIERSYMKSTLTATAVDAEMIVLLQDPTRDEIIFPPVYISMFNKPSLGIITKVDIATKEQIEHAKYYLQLAGVNKIVCISNTTKEGINEVIDIIRRNKKDNILQS